MLFSSASMIVDEEPQPIHKKKEVLMSAAEKDRE